MSEVANSNSIYVSVIIPVYNVELYLEECLESIMNQSLKQIEIICINDGSTDNSVLILERIAKTDARIQIVHQENQGLSATRNVGMRLAKGDYIHFMDSDDIFRTDGLKLLYDRAQAESLDILYFNGYTFHQNDDGEWVKMLDQSRLNRLANQTECMSGKDLYMLWKGQFRPYVCLALYRRQYLQGGEVAFLEGILNEDLPFTLEALLQANNVKNISEQLYFYRIHSESITSNTDVQKSFHNVYSFYKSCIHLADIYIKINHEEVICRLFLRTISSRPFFYFFNLYPHLSATDKARIDVKGLKDTLYDLHLYQPSQVAADCKVTLVLVVRNNESQLKAALTEFAAQSLSNHLEILCVNDGSAADNSQAELEALQAVYPNIGIIETVRLGKDYAVKRALDYAQGEYIFIADIEDRFSSPDILEKLYDAAQQSSVEACSGLEGSRAQQSGLLSCDDATIDLSDSGVLYQTAWLKNQSLEGSEYGWSHHRLFHIKAKTHIDSIYVLPEEVYKKKMQDYLVYPTQQQGLDYINEFLVETRKALEGNQLELHDKLITNFEANFSYRERRRALAAENKQLKQDKQREIEKLKQDKQREIEKLKQDKHREIEKLKQDKHREISRIKSGLSFRVGRAVTYLPRKVLKR